MTMTIVYTGIGLIAAAVFTLVLVVALGLTSGGPTGVAKSLALIDGTVGERTVVKTDLATKDRLVTPIFDRTRGLATALSPSGTTERLAKSLDRAGNPSPWTVERVMGVKGTALIVGALLGLLYGGGLSFSGILVACALGVGCFYLPDLLLYNAGLKRQEQVAKGLAEALDMLTICVEAGQGFDSALMRVARNTEGPIAGEFARVISEIQIGKSRGEAFAALGDRVVLPDVKNFVSSIVQADRLGLPIAAVLREQTSAMRLARRQKAEEKAQKVTVKILFPMLLFIFPAMFIVIIGPGAIRMIETFSGTGL
jgi:tight adherence protein C